MLRPLCIVALAASTLALPGCVIVVDHNHETHWVSSDEAGHGRIGVYLESVDSATASQLSLEASHATLVERVVEGSAADQAGLKPFDVITTVDGDADASPSKVRAAIRAHKPGEAVSFSILRQGKPQNISVIIK